MYEGPACDCTDLCAQMAPARPLQYKCRHRTPCQKLIKMRYNILVKNMHASLVACSYFHILKTLVFIVWIRAFGLSWRATYVPPGAQILKGGRLCIGRHALSKIMVQKSVDTSQCATLNPLKSAL
jgi:hypothetical protein